MNNMTASEYQICITNKKIWSFYQEHKHINIESTNLLLISFLESIFNHATADQASNINSQLLSFMNENKTQIDNIKGSLNSIHDNVCKLNTDITNNMMIQFMNLKKDYIEDVKQIVTNSTLTTSEKIGCLIDKNSNHLIDKTSLILNDVIPKNQENNNKQMREEFIKFHSLISEDTTRLAKSINGDKSLNDFIQNFETKYTSMMQTFQQPLYSFMTASEDRINNNINVIKESSTTNTQAQTKVFNELGDFLGKYKNSSNKGRFGENQLCSILNTIYTNADIADTTGIKASGDFIMKRADKPSIMFENKEYENNINKEEIAKFIRDADNQGINGIFLSQYSGIAFKTNYQIDINKGCVLVYIQNCEYSVDKIKIAVDIIDNLYPRIQDMQFDDTNTISKDTLDDINEEYQTFISQKESMITVLRDFQKRMNTQIEELRLPILDKYLEPKYAYVKTRSFACELCNSFSTGTKQSLSAHKRGCSKKVKSSITSNNTVIDQTPIPLRNAIVINTVPKPAASIISSNLKTGK